MKYFLDTEFIEDGKTIDLMSIGIVCEDGREYYAQNVHAGFSRANDWVVRNVFPSLEHFDMGTKQRSCKGDHDGLVRYVKHATMCDREGFDNRCPWRSRSDLRQDIRAFCDPEKYGHIE